MKMTRRAALGAALAATAATGAQALALPFPSNDRTAWAAALTSYERAEAEYNRLSALIEAATEAFEAETGEPNPIFETYSVNKHPTIRERDEHIRFVEVKVAMIDHAGQRLAPADYGTIAKKAAQLVDDYEADLERREEIGGRILDGPEAAWEAGLDALSNARTALVQTPAPDGEAMLLKLDILNAYLTECDSEDKERVAAITADARRLISRRSI